MIQPCVVPDCAWPQLSEAGFDTLGSIGIQPSLWILFASIAAATWWLVPFSLGLVAAGSRDTAPALLRVGAILIGLWGVCGVAGVGLGYTSGWVAVDLQDDVAGATLIRLFEGITYSPWGLIGGGLGGGAYVLAVLATGIGLILARGIPSWTGILVLAAPIAMFTGGPLGIPLLAASGFVLLAIGLAGTIPVLLGKPPLLMEAPATTAGSVDYDRPERSVLR